MLVGGTPFLLKGPVRNGGLTMDLFSDSIIILHTPMLPDYVSLRPKILGFERTGRMGFIPRNRGSNFRLGASLSLKSNSYCIVSSSYVNNVCFRDVGKWVRLADVCQRKMEQGFWEGDFWRKCPISVVSSRNRLQIVINACSPVPILSPSGFLLHFWATASDKSNICIPFVKYQEAYRQGWNRFLQSPSWLTVSWRSTSGRWHPVVSSPTYHVTLWFLKLGFACSRKVTLVRRHAK